MIDLQKLPYSEYLGAIKDESIDCVITAPLFWTINKQRNNTPSARLKNKQGRPSVRKGIAFDTINPSELLTVMKEICRVLKPDTHAYIFCGAVPLRYMLSYADNMEWTKVKPLIWDKRRPGLGYTYRDRHEFVVFLQKGSRKLNSLSVPDVLICDRIDRGYKCEKPVPLLEIFVSQSTEEGDIVCDPFFRSGSVAIACENLGRSFTGTDKDAGAHEYYHEKRNLGGYRMEDGVVLRGL